MEDVQNLPDGRRVPIDRVGVSNLSYPIVVLDRANQRQSTVASLTMSVSLPHYYKGTHMSRFVEVLNAHRGDMTMFTLTAVLRELRSFLQAESARVEVRFPYFLERVAPVSRAKALISYECSFIGEASEIKNDFVLGVRVPVTSLCPCSKAISDYGAHNQRGYVTIEVRGPSGGGNSPQLIWIEELVEVAERSASAPVFALLKREDERFVTMQAFENPAFVEDIVRNAALTLREDSRVNWFRVRAENQESIHNHDAFAQVEWPHSWSANSKSRTQRADR
jgi:GTP cyclohydrolase I